MFKSIAVGGPRSSSVVVVGQFKGKPPHSSSKMYDSDGSVAGAGKRPEATGELGCLAEAFPAGSSRGKKASRVIIVGLGEKKKLDADAMRTLGAAIVKRASQIKASSISIDLDGPIKEARLDVSAMACALGEGLGLANWHYDRLRGTASTIDRLGKLSVHGSSKAFDRGLERGLGLAESANVARDLSQTPPNIATTTYMASEARKIARQTGLKCTVFKGESLKKNGLTGLQIVGAASEHAPCMVRLEYTPSRGGKRSKPTVLVGKTIVYDTGGLSLKVNNGMKGMKRDKDGGCAVIGAMHAVATVIKPNHRVVALLMIAENSVSDEAYRPDDVITMGNGVTVEVTNTDAEGRLVLADGLYYACAKEDPGALINMATLTGGVVVALGSVFAGLWCDDDALRRRIEEAGEATGERVWRLPHDEKYRQMMKSPVADIVNSAPVREAHPIQGAAFLSYFVEEGIPWAHIDIAGVHEASSARGPFQPGPTGFGVRLMAELLG
ncbi:MAG TPA: leucyl aminopeptidase family protein [Phycisphaerales bacterium]|nr:leucyl aminopeptidase family protein [Phycisphaerales bacterium]